MPGLYFVHRRNLTRRPYCVNEFYADRVLLYSCVGRRAVAIGIPFQRDVFNLLDRLPVISTTSKPIHK